MFVTYVDSLDNQDFYGKDKIVGSFNCTGCFHNEINQVYQSKVNF